MTEVKLREDEVRNAMVGATIDNVIYRLDGGREAMYLVFDRFTVVFEPVRTPGTDHVHLKHRLIQGRPRVEGLSVT